MFKLLTRKASIRSKPKEKILITILVLFFFRLGNAIPLPFIDQEAFKKFLLQANSNNPILQILNIYSGAVLNFLTPFSLGIIPFINSSIIIDLLTALFPFLEKLQAEEGEFGRKKIIFYKKVLALIFSVVQSYFLTLYIKPYFYSANNFTLGLVGLELVTGSMIIIWLCHILDNEGIGNGTSLIILTNIVVTLLGKQSIIFKEIFNLNFLIEICFLFILIIFICISQTARINIEVVSARQLAFLENIERVHVSNKDTNSFQPKENGLSIRLNQAGIFPIIIASNLAPGISYIIGDFFAQKKFIETIIYYGLIIGFNYFYTILFWDPEKISEQLRKASVSIVNITPGQETISYLENVVRSSSIIGGVFLCAILLIYEFAKHFFNGNLLSKINISSLIIVVGVAYEIQKTIRALYKNNLEKIY